MAKNKSRSWLILDIVSICLLITLALLGGMDERNFYLGALFFFTIGFLFLTSKNMKSELNISKALYWVAVNIFKPRTKFNHIIGGGLLIFAGIAIYASDPLTSSERKFFDNLENTPEFWIAMIFVLLFNVLVGIYTARRIRKKN